MGAMHYYQVADFNWLLQVLYAGLPHHTRKVSAYGITLRDLNFRRLHRDFLFLTTKTPDDEIGLLNKHPRSVARPWTRVVLICACPHHLLGTI